MLVVMWRTCNDFFLNKKDFPKIKKGTFAPLDAFRKGRGMGDSPLAPPLRRPRLLLLTLTTISPEYQFMIHHGEK